MSLLPIEEAVAAHQNPHLVSVGGAEPAGRGSGTAAPLSRSLLPLFSPPSARGYRCSGSRATMQPPTLTQVTQGPVVASRDGRTDGQMRATLSGSPQKQSRLGKKPNDNIKQKRCRLGLCERSPSVPASQLQQTASRSHCSSVSPPSLPLPRSPSRAHSPSLSLSR